MGKSFDSSQIILENSIKLAFSNADSEALEILQKAERENIELERFNAGQGDSFIKVKLSQEELPKVEKLLDDLHNVFIDGTELQDITSYDIVKDGIILSHKAAEMLLEPIDQSISR